MGADSRCEFVLAGAERPGHVPVPGLSEARDYGASVVVDSPKLPRATRFSRFSIANTAGTPARIPAGTPRDTRACTLLLSRSGRCSRDRLSGTGPIGQG